MIGRYKCGQNLKMYIISVSLSITKYTIITYNIYCTGLNDQKQFLYIHNIFIFDFDLAKFVTIKESKYYIENYVI